MSDSDHDNQRDEQEDLQYLPLDQINFSETFNGLCSLTLFHNDVYLRMQAFNIKIIDQWTTEVEYKVLREYLDKETTPHEAFFLNAQSQMWIMAVYEMLRTWRQRVTYVERHIKTGTLKDEIAKLKQDDGYFHAGKETRIAVFENALEDDHIVERIARDMRRLHIPFRRIEAIRMVLAKHEERGRKNSIANMPGYGRINKWCGSLDYELAVGRSILGTISRRDIADSIRSLAANESPPDDASLESFDVFMRGPSTKDEAVLTKTFNAPSLRAKPI